MKDKITHDDIVNLVDTFYVNIRKTSPLKEIFEKAIGQTDEEWKPHLETMYSFWSSLMLRAGTYNGNPMAAHVALGYFPPELFNLWLKIFEETCSSLFSEEIKKEFVHKATMIATTLKARLYPEPVKINKTLLGSRS